MPEDVRDRPRYRTEDAIKLAKQHFGINAIARNLPGERDQNFELQDGAGKQYVLKLAHPATEIELLELQNEAMRHVASTGRPQCCPQVVESKQGAWIVPVEGESGERHFMRLLTYLPGKPLAKATPHSPQLLLQLGSFLAEISSTLASFSHPAAQRELSWDLTHVQDVVSSRLHLIQKPQQNQILQHFLQLYESTVWPRRSELRSSIIHNDANDYNVMVELNDQLQHQVVGVIDFGDILYSSTIHELAICLAYAMLDKSDPLTAASQVIAGYHQGFPLTDVEVEFLFPLACMRLCTSVCMSAEQRQLVPENEYLSISEKPAWKLLEQLAGVSSRLAHYQFRQACGMTPSPSAEPVLKWLREHSEQIGRVVETPLTADRVEVLDLSVRSPWLINGPQTTCDELSKQIHQVLNAADRQVGIGRYDEPRLVYTSDQFAAGSDATDQRRTIHLGIDLFMPAGSEVFAPLDGVVHSFQDNDKPLDYGATILLQHDVPELDRPFFTLYGHLSRKSLVGLQRGMVIKRGDRIASLGQADENGGWPPHLHFQIMTDLMGFTGDFPGVGDASRRELWRSICPDPNLILKIPASCFPEESLGAESITRTRREHVNPSLSLSYQEPLNIVRGWRQFLFDDTGRRYLDCVNNVCHVGHCHPRVVRAAQQQIAVLNTNTRYLHDHLVRYAERLVGLFPDPLNVCFLVCSGSEANDLALRMAQTATGRRDTIVVDHAYHGNLSSLIDLSPYKHDGPGGRGAPDHVHPVCMPDLYRGPYRRNDPQAATKYAAEIQRVIDEMAAQGREPAAFFCESLLGCGGQVVLPEGYLDQAYRFVRASGGLCVADEVQVGFGRVGSHMWGFETQEVVPDIVTLGKPIGNGHPLAAVVTTHQIANAFANGMEYFNTFGGNPVSCSIGLAVLDVIRDEQLQQHALQVGDRLKKGLLELAQRHQVIGDVRGMGLFLGIELVLDRESLAPADKIATYVIERMKQHGILVSTDGPLHNVLKIKPPLVFTAGDAERFIQVLDRVLSEDAACL